MATRAVSYRLDSEVLEELAGLAHASHATQTEILRRLILDAAGSGRVELYDVRANDDGLEWRFRRPPWHGDEIVVILTDSNGTERDPRRWSYRCAAADVDREDAPVTPLGEDDPYWTCRRIITEHVARNRADQALRPR